MTLNLTAELWRALRRAGLAAILVGAWCAYSLGVPISSGTAALKAALVKKAPAKPAAASVSWVNGGAPIDTADMSALKKEAEGNSRKEKGGSMR